jgi:hypothetical protein
MINLQIMVTRNRHSTTGRVHDGRIFHAFIKHPCRRDLYFTDSRLKAKLLHPYILVGLFGIIACSPKPTVDTAYILPVSISANSAAAPFGAPRITSPNSWHALLHSSALRITSTTPSSPRFIKFSHAWTPIPLADTRTDHQSMGTRQQVFQHVTLRGGHRRHRDSTSWSSVEVTKRKGQFKCNTQSLVFNRCHHSWEWSFSPRSLDSSFVPVLSTRHRRDGTA